LKKRVYNGFIKSGKERKMFEVLVVDREGNVMFKLMLTAMQATDLQLNLSLPEGSETWVVPFADLACDLYKFYNEEF
jgi:hypothetical protein